MELKRPVKWVKNVDWRVTQWFWENAEYYKTIWRPYHLGIDYAWSTPWLTQAIYAAEDWLVTLAWWDTTWFGNLVKIQWASGTTYYAHLSAISVKKWEYVKANQQIGLSWETGNSKWVHLHFWWKPLDKRMINWNWWWDPTKYISDWDTVPVQEKPKNDPLIDRLIKDWIWNWIEWDWVTYRVALLIAKAKYN